MTTSEAIAAELPYLRRYARALTGRADIGDRHVGAVLDALVTGAAILDDDVPLRLALYRLFARFWNAAPIPLAASIGPDRTIADLRIESVTPLPRQAFLLDAVEGFDRAAVAYILDLSPDEADELKEEAGRQIAAQVTTRVLIIEDEPIIAMELESQVTALGHAVIGIARTHLEARDLIEGRRPGLVLADIRLADGSSGLDAVNEILRSFPVPVIFITAYPDSLLTGQRPEPTFLISKPFRSSMISAVIAQALFFDIKPKMSSNFSSEAPVSAGNAGR